MSYNLDACALYTYGTRAAEMIEAGFNEKLLDGKYQQAFRFLASHVDKGEMPAIDDMERLFGAGILQETKVDPVWIIGELKKRLLHHYLTVGHDTVYAHLKNNAPELAFSTLQKLIENAPTTKEQSSHSLFDEIDTVKERVEASIAGIDGIDTPWPSFNKLTRGFLPSESTWFCARPGVGKTWIVLILCAWLWSQRHKPNGPKVKILVVSPELKREEIAERFFTFVTETSYVKTVSGTFDTFGKNAFFEKMDKFKNSVDFWIMDEDDNPTAERIEAQILLRQPDIVAIDAAYEIKWNDDHDDMKRFNYGSTLIRKWTRQSWPTSDTTPLWPAPKKPGRKSISFLVSTQLNRSGSKKGESEGKKKKEETPLENQIAMTDRLLWAADRMFILSQNPDEKADRVMEMLKVKVRRAGDMKITSIKARWDMDKMDFNEIDAPPAFEDKIPAF